MGSCPMSQLVRRRGDKDRGLQASWLHAMNVIDVRHSEAVRIHPIAAHAVIAVIAVQAFSAGRDKWANFESDDRVATHLT